MGSVLTQELKDLILNCLEVKDLELVDLSQRFQGKRMVLTVLADRISGRITLEECALLCRQLNDLIEEKNIVSGDYLLEVSSPGLDRPLKKSRDFTRSLNKEAVFFLNDLVSGKCQWQGLISKVDGFSVFIQVDGQILEFPLSKINKAQLVIS